GRLTAVIDFGTTGAGDPACDLFPAWTLLPAEARQTFRQVVHVDDATWTRGRGRARSQALIALPHYRVTNPAMAHNARHVSRAVLEELCQRPGPPTTALTTKPCCLCNSRGLCAHYSSRGKTTGRPDEAGARTR